MFVGTHVCYSLEEKKKLKNCKLLGVSFFLFKLYINNVLERKTFTGKTRTRHYILCKRNTKWLEILVRKTLL